MNKKLRVGDKEIIFLTILVGLMDLFLQGWMKYKGVGILNSGFSFGMGSGGGVILNLTIMFLLFWGWRYFIETRMIGLFLILIGGTVNFLMRASGGGVWDYLSLPLMPFRNNLSDILISLGVILLVWKEVRK